MQKRKDLQLLRRTFRFLAIFFSNNIFRPNKYFSTLGLISGIRVPAAFYKLKGNFLPRILTKKMIILRFFWACHRVKFLAFQKSLVNFITFTEEMPRQGVRRKQRERAAKVAGEKLQAGSVLFSQWLTWLTFKLLGIAYLSHIW